MQVKTSDPSLDLELSLGLGLGMGLGLGPGPSPLAIWLPALINSDSGALARPVFYFFLRFLSQASEFGPRWLGSL